MVSQRGHSLCALHIHLQQQCRHGSLLLTPAEVVLHIGVNRAGKLKIFMTAAEVVVHIGVNRAGNFKKKKLTPAEVV